MMKQFVLPYLSSDNISISTVTFCHSYCFICVFLTIPPGTRVFKVGETKLPYGHVPLMLYNGEVTLQTASGKIVPLLLESHSMMENEKHLADMHNEEINAGLEKCIALRR